MICQNKEVSDIKRVVSISLGSSKRDHKVEVDILGERFSIERIGTDGDRARAIELIRGLDGKVDAFGMGGIDLYLQAGRKRLILRDALPIARAAKITPIVDGSGLKNTLERRVVSQLARSGQVPFADREVLLVSGVDRFGMAEALLEAGARVTFGDLIFTVGLPIPLRSLRALEVAATIVGPVLSQFPIEWLYPTGSKQEHVTSKYRRYYDRADVIAGDFHFIRRYMPEELHGKTVLTNTVTREDVDELARRGVTTLVTTTPELDGRSFGTNVMEGVLLVLAGKRWEEMTPADYETLLDRIGFQPRVQRLSLPRAS